MRAFDLPQIYRGLHQADQFNGSLPLTKYHQIYLVLRQQLSEGYFLNGLPGEKALAEAYGVGRVTIRRALDQLAHEGLIVREVGRGTRPASPKPKTQAESKTAGAISQKTRLTGLMQNIVDVSRGTWVRVIEWRIIRGTGAIAEALMIPPGEKVRKAVRRRNTALGPVSLITTHVPLALVAATPEDDLVRKPMLQILEESGVDLGRATQTVSARQADALAARELQVPLGSALLSVRRLVFDVNDRPVQLLHGLYRPDRYEYEMEISQIGGIEARINAKELISP